MLVDMGLAFRQIMIGLDFEVSSLAGALLSHAHGDHAKAARDLMSRGIRVYASAPTWEHLKLAHHRAETITALVPFEVGPWRVKPFNAVHDMPGTLGFQIDSPDGDRLLYLTDSGYSPYTFDGLTHIAIEANFSREALMANALDGTIGVHRAARTLSTHMSIERLIEMLKANDLSKVEEIYLLHLSDTNSDENDFRRQVERATGRPTFVASKNAL